MDWAKTQPTNAKMLFANWWIVGEYTLAFLMIGSGAIAFYKAKNQSRPLARVGIRLFTIPLIGLGTLSGLLLTLIELSGCESHSVPIYSPSEHSAIVVYDLDEGATGGSTSVELFWAKGLRQANIFVGPWKCVEPDDIHWVNDSKVNLFYQADGPQNEYQCKSTSVVRVICTPK
jgi:hypothetical protein